MLKFVNNRFSLNPMRFILILLLIAFQVNAQPRINKSLPIFSEKPISTLKKGVTGWSFSNDGQWVSEKRTIPIVTTSRNVNAYRTRSNRIGLDNFKELKIYPVISGNDTLVLLVKFFEDGFFKYRKSNRGWQRLKKCHYYIFNKNTLDILDGIKDSIVQNVSLKLLDDGEFIYKYKSEVLNKIKRKIVLDPDYGREFTMTIQPFTQDEKIRFQFYSQHIIYRDVSGVLKDFQMGGNTMYGKLELFNHLYYEMDLDDFSSFFAFPQSFRFKN